MEQFKKLDAAFTKLDEKELLTKGGLSKKTIRAWNKIFAAINSALPD